VDLVFACQVVLDRSITGKALGIGQAELEFGADLRRNGAGFTGRGLNGEQRGQASSFIAPQPGADRMAMHSHQLGQREPGSRLAAGQQGEGLQAVAFLRVVLGAQLFL
jgi:hypothetical protein